MSAKPAPPSPVPNGHVASESANWVSGEKTIFEERKPSFSERKPRERTEPKAESETLLGSLCAVIYDNQIGLSVNLVLLLALTHIFFPRARRRTSKFFNLSYYNPDNDLYGCGADDLPFVALWIVIFTGLRVIVMEYLLDPIARYNGIKSKKGLMRFKEQAWLVMYCTYSWSLGMYLIYNSEYWLNLNGMWKGWPFREVTGLHKWYYLMQWSFYLQQMLVVNIEEKRKDYLQMFTHHVFTGALIFLSYGFYQMPVGTVILCIMDIIDIVLPSAKLLKYMGYTTACDYVFGLFVVVWFVTRHALYPLVYYSVYAHAPVAIPTGCYFTDGTVVLASDTSRFEALGGNDIWSNILKAYTDRSAPVCWNPTLRWCFLSLLIALQFIICLWAYTIVIIIYKVLSGKGADDERSDAEDEGEDLEVDDEIANMTHPINGIKSSHDLPSPVEEEVGVEALNLNARRGSVSVRKNKRNSITRSSGARTSAISIPGHGDHKELLGRIGCDKPA